MTDLLGPGGVIAVMVLAGLIGLVALLRWPEILVAVLLTGQGFISLGFKLLDLEVNRRTFAVAGTVIFLPIVLLLLLGRLMGKGRVAEKEPFFGRRSVLFILLLVSIVIVIASGLSYTSAPEYESEKFRELLTFGIAPFFLAFFFIRDLPGLRRLLWWVVLMGSFFLGIEMAYSFVTTGSIISGTRYPDRTFWGPFEISSQVELGFRAAICFVSVLILAGSARHRIWRLLVVPYLILLVAMVLSAGARAPLLVMFALGLFVPKMLDRGRWVASSIAGVALVLVMAGYFVLAPEESKWRFTEPLTTEYEGGLSVMYRIQAWRSAVDMIATRPVTGYGTGGFAMYAFGVDDEFFPHNMFLELFAENGILGLVLIVAMWVAVAYALRRSYLIAPARSTAFYAVCWAAGLLIVEVGIGMFSYGLAHAASTFLLTCAIALKVCALVEHQALSSPKGLITPSPPPKRSLHWLDYPASRK